MRIDAPGRRPGGAVPIGGRGGGHPPDGSVRTSVARPLVVTTAWIANYRAFAAASASCTREPAMMPCIP